MEIEVGEWIRTRAGHIHKITKICPYYENGELIYDEQIVELEGRHSGWKVYQLESIIINHSKNIIDLIEVGDLIKFEYDNAVYIEEIIRFDKGDTYMLEVCFSPEDGIGYNVNIFDEDIKILSIVTKEQFQSVEYRLEDT